MSRIVILLLGIIMSTGSILSAQQIKVGFVQIERLLQDFSEYKDANDVYSKELEAWQKQMGEYQTAIQAMAEEFQQRAGLYSQERKQKEQEKMLNKRQEATKFYQDTFAQGGKAEQRKMELLSPIHEKVIKAIDILGKRDNYSLILNDQSLLFGKDQLDLTDEVLKILKAGVPYSPVSTTPSAGPKK
jgi:outer membrane protein